MLLVNLLLAFLCMALIASVLYLLPQFITTGFVGLCPIIAGVSILLLRTNPKTRDQNRVGKAIDEAMLQVRYKKNLTTCMFAFLFTFLFACITGFKMDSFTPEQYFQHNLSIIIVACLLISLILFLIQRFRSVEFLTFICFLVQATALLLLPFIANSTGGYFLAFSLNNTCGFICQVLLILAILQHDPKTGIPSAFNPIRVLLAILMLGLMSIAGAFIGGVIYRYLGLNSSAIAVVAIIILYIIFLVFGVMAQKRERVEHILTGRFDSEAELADYRSHILAKQYPSLTARELEVLALLLRGRNTISISETLIISENTAKSHIQHIYKKLGIRSRQDLLKFTDNIPLEKS